MPTPVVIVTSGGRPVTNVTSGEPMTPVSSGGEPVTLVDNGEPVALVNDDLSQWASQGFDQLVASLISAGETVAFYDPNDLTSVFAARTGGANAVADGPVGLMLDKAQMGGLTAEAFIAAQPELSLSAWTYGAGTSDGGSGSINFSAATASSYSNAGLVNGSFYVLTFTVSGFSGGLVFPKFGYSSGPVVTSDGTYTFAGFTASGGPWLYFSANSFTGTIDNITIRELPGYHATAPSDAARPILRDVSSTYALDFDNVDDAFAWTTPAITDGTWVALTRDGSYAASAAYSAGTYTMPVYQPFDLCAILWTSADLTTVQEAIVLAEGSARGAAADFGGVTSFLNGWRSHTDLRDFPAIDTSNGTNFSNAWDYCNGLTSFSLLDTSSGTNFFRAWYQCTSLTSFSALDFSSGTIFRDAWRGCTSLTTFPANMFDTCPATNFINAFISTNLTQTSIDNILVSINTAGRSGGTFDQSGGSAPSVLGEVSIDQLAYRLWAVTVTGGYESPYGVVRALNDATESSALYDPSDLTSLYQSRTGGANVTADGQPVGLMLDKAQMQGKTAADFIADQPELVTNGWTLSVGWSVSADGATLTQDGTGAGLTHVVKLINVPVGFIEVSFDVSASTGTDLLDGAGVVAANLAAGSYTIIIYNDFESTNNLRIRPDGEAVVIDNISIKELPGYHATAPSDAARPLYRAGPSRLDFDNVDDAMSWTTPAITDGTWVAITSSGAYAASAAYSAGTYTMPIYQPFDIERIFWTSADLTTVQEDLVRGDTDFGGVTDFTNGWRNRTDLRDFPVIDTSSGTTFRDAWLGCSSLTSFPLLDVSSGTNFISAWYNCSSLTSFPLLDVSSGTNFNSAWRNCTSLTTFPANMFDSVTATNFINAFGATNLTQTSIDNILVSINTAGTSSGTFDQSGGSAPSATGEAAIDALRGRGWTVTVTGGY
jgi:hypothetical protein